MHFCEILSGLWLDFPEVQLFRAAQPTQWTTCRKAWGQPTTSHLPGELLFAISFLPAASPPSAANNLGVSKAIPLGSFPGYGACLQESAFLPRPVRSAVWKALGKHSGGAGRCLPLGRTVISRLRVTVAEAQVLCIAVNPPHPGPISSDSLCLAYMVLKPGWGGQR